VSKASINSSIAFPASSSSGFSRTFKADPLIIGTSSPG